MPGTLTRNQFSFVNEYPTAVPEAAQYHFLSRLAVETDPADVSLDLERVPERIQVVDVRSPDAYESCHVRGAINLPWRSIDDLSTAGLDRDRTLVVYCWGPACNAAHKGAARLAGLGFRVKEMIGGLEYWQREGHAVEGTQRPDAPTCG